MGTRHPEFGLTADFNIGDWFTPEHGTRININGGKWSTRGLKAKYLDLSLDYLLNITAIAQPGTYYETKRFEVYGIAGFDLATSNHNNVTKYGMGIHIGLRGQYALSASSSGNSRLSLRASLLRFMASIMSNSLRLPVAATVL